MDGVRVWNPPHKMAAGDVVDEAGEVDLISSLPYDVLLAIVSSLSLEGCASLSAVSRQCRRLALSEFFHCRFPRPCSDASIDPPPSIRRFHLVNLFGKEDHPALRQALDAAEELAIQIDAGHGNEIFLPDFVLRIRTLRVLSVKNYEMVPWIIECTLLQALKLEGCRLDKFHIEGILARCRLLETLHIVGCHVFTGIDDFGIISINSESLTNLRCRNVRNVLFSPDAPNLEVLNLEFLPVCIGQLVSYPGVHAVHAPKVQKISLSLEILSKMGQENSLDLVEWRVRCTELMSKFLFASKDLTSFTLHGELAKLSVAKNIIWPHKKFDYLMKMNQLEISLDVSDEAQAMLLVNLTALFPRLSQLNLLVVPGGVTAAAAAATDTNPPMLVLSEELKKLFKVILRATTEPQRYYFQNRPTLKKFALSLPEPASPDSCANNNNNELESLMENELVEYISSFRAPRNVEESCADRNGYRTIKMEF